MSLFTAIVLSAKPVTLALPGVQVLGCTQVLRSPAELHAARLDALAKVQTPYCFYLDDDDALPDDYLSVLQACRDKMQAKGTALAYTDEILREAGKEDVRRTTYDYDSDLHAVRPMLVHHLAVMDTAKAQTIAADLPRGNFWTEHMLYWALGRLGATYVYRTGYIWNRNPRGFSRDPRILAAQVMSSRWIAMERRGAQ
ncbi:MAG: hypothetical protein RR715_02975 [Comamonas sp.]